MSDEEVATAEALRAEYDKLEQAHSDAEELAEDVDQRLGEIETALAALDDRPVKYDPEEITRAGAFVSIDGSGILRVERAYVRPEDEPAVPQSEPETCATDAGAIDAAAVEGAEPEVSSPADQEEPEEDEGLKPIPDRLMTELTAYRTLALRDALAQNPDVAFLPAFYRCTSESCVEIDVKSVVFGNQAPGLNDPPLRRPSTTGITVGPSSCRGSRASCGTHSFDTDSRQALFAHCVALSVNAVHESWNRRPRVLAHADRVAGAVDLDVAAAGWSPTVDNYLGRVTKARIIQAVREAKGEQAAQLIDHLKKGEMAERAQELLACSSWLPEPLRTPGRAIMTASPAPAIEAGSPVATGGEESAPIGGETAMAESNAAAEDGPVATEPQRCRGRVIKQ
jgi:ParB family chromosome partitioning protein